MIVGMFVTSKMLIFFVGDVFLLYFWNVLHLQTSKFVLAIMLIWGKHHIFLPPMISFLQYFSAIFELNYKSELS